MWKQIEDNGQGTCPKCKMLDIYNEGAKGGTNNTRRNVKIGRIRNKSKG